MHSTLPLLASCVLALISLGADAFSLQTRSSARLPSEAFMTRGGIPENPLDGGELLSTLDSLDREWRAQQLAEGSDSRWTKVVIPSDTPQPVSPQAAAYEPYQDYVYLLEPPSGKPDYVISFLGGAGE